MAQPSYTTDIALVTVSAAEDADADSNTGWYEMTGHTGGGADTADTDYFIQGTGCVTQSFGSKTGTQVGLEFRSGADTSSFSDGTSVFLIWHVVLAGNAMETFDNGGMRIYIGSSTGNVNGWKVGGSDFGRNPYGGWHNVAVDPTYNSSTPDYTEGSPASSNYQIYCSLPNMVAGVSKGNLHGMDAIRWGRGELKIEYGDVTNGYGTFSELANANDANDVSFTADVTNADATLTNINATEVTKLYPGAPIAGTGIPGSTTVKYIASTTSVEMTANATATNAAETITSQPYNRWGLFQAEGTGYLWKGLMSFGNVTNACDFRDSNANITVDIVPRVYSTFNKIEINNASSRVDWTGVNITSLTHTAQQSPGSFEMTADATVNFTTCVFTDLSTFIFDSNATLTGVTFRRCGQVTQAGGTFTSCTFDNSTAAASILSDDPGLISNSTFVSDGSNHAIQLTAATAGNTYSLAGNTFTSYATSNGSTGNEVIYNNSGGAVTINASNTTGTISVRNEGVSTTTVNNNVTVTITVQDSGANAIVGAQVAVFKTSDDSELHSSSPTDENGEVAASVAASTGAIYIRVRQSTNTASFLTTESSSDGIQAASDYVHFSSNHGFVDGEAVVYSKNSGSATTNMSDGTTYYLNSIDADTVSVHTTAAFAIAGTPLFDLASDAAGETHSFDPVRYIPTSTVATVGTESFGVTVTMVVDSTVTG